MLSRLKKVTDNLKTLGFDAGIITAPDAIYYLVGHHIHPGERLMALLIIPGHTPQLYLHSMFRVEARDFDVVYYGDDDQPLNLMGQVLKGAKTLGVDKTWPAHFILSLMAIMPDVTFKVGSSAVDDARMIKEEDEISLMKASSDLNDQVMARVFDHLGNDNFTESQLKATIADEFKALGASGVSFDTIVCFGQTASEPHHVSDDTPKQAGSVIIDMGCIYKGYCSDMTRSFYIGQPPKAYKDAYEAVLKANQAAIENVKPGVPLSDIDAAARQVITQAGYGDYFIHRTGHGIGLDVHEFPDVSGSSQAVCTPGMIFSIEPGIYMPGEWGIRIEDLVLVTETGYELLNHFDKELRVIESSN